MKKFITTSPLQGNLKIVRYEAADNKELQMEEKTGFPVIAMLNAYVEKGEEVQLLVLCHNYKFSEVNFEKLKEEVQLLEERNGIQCRIKKITVEYNECIEEHLNNFKHLIEYLDDGDELYACMSYGTKAMPIIEMMALNYAYRAKQNCHIACIAYGNINFLKEENRDEAKIYDMTSLFYMDEAVRLVSQMKIHNPIEIIQQILEL